MSKDKKTLVILTPGFPSSEEDSTCLPLQQHFIRALRAMHPELSIIILSFQYPYFIKKYNWSGSTVFSYSGRNKGGLARLLLRRKIYAALKEIHASSKITGILSFWLGECALTGKRFAERNGLRHYCWIFGQDARKENKYGRRVRPAASELIALSDFLQDEFEKNHGIRPLHIIPLGMSSASSCNSDVEKDIAIVGAGSLIPLKQYPVFLRVVAAVQKQLPGIKVVLAGDGPEKEKLQTIITESGLQDTVALSGELPHAEILQLMQRAKVFLHPSFYEGFSGVCLEALSRGAHVVSFCRAMKKEIEQWHIVQSEEEMTQKTLDILQTPGLPYKNSTAFTADHTANNIMELFRINA